MRTRTPVTGAAQRENEKAIFFLLTRSMNRRRVDVNKEELKAAVEWVTFNDSAQNSGLTAKVGHLDISSAFSRQSGSAV